MPSGFHSYKSARQNAEKRLSNWIQSIKETKNDPSGIARLQKVHRNLFKRIEWKPKDGFEVSMADSSAKLQQAKMPPCDEDESEMITPNLASLYLEEHQIHDSNSSNVSSRIQSRRDEIKYSETRSPLLITPNSRAENLENPVKTLRNSEDINPKLKPELNQTAKSKTLSIPIQFPHRRKRKKHRKAEPEVPGFAPTLTFTDDQQHQQQRDMPAVPHFELTTISLAPSKLSVTQSSLNMLKRNSSMRIGAGFPETNIKLSAKGAVDNHLKKHMKPQKPSRYLGSSRHDIVFMKEETRELSTEERRQKVLERFRKMVRTLIHIRVLLNVSRIRIEEEEKSKGFKKFDGGTELTFDATMYKTALSYGGLTSRARKALKKNPVDRTKEDSMILMDVMLRLSVFMKYPKSVRQDLARVMWYDNFQDGRVVIKQDDPGSRMYFVLSGEVDLKRTDILDTGSVISYHVQTIRAGFTFGELALIRDMKREFTAICKGDCEFLSLGKEEFNQVLRSRWEKECNLRFNFLRSCDFFQTWTDKQLQTCADSSLLKEYADNTVILGDTDGQSESVYFIRKGCCDVVRRIQVVRQGSPYLRPQLLLPENAEVSHVFLDKSYARNRRLRRRETHFLTVTTLHTGSYFGAGECLRDTFILSRGKTECVLINCAQYSIQGKSEQLRTLKRDRENALPSNRTLYHKFQANRRWSEYRQKVLREVLDRKSTKKAFSKMSDVPKAILREPAIPQDLIHPY